MIASRRAALLQIGALAACAAAEPTVASTPPETEGPFFPPSTNIERDADLTRLAGRNERAAGQVIEVRARVLAADGTPMPGARLELWQANAAGRYAHPRDASAVPLDPNFQGYGLLETGSDGDVRFVTVMPGAYHIGGAGSEVRTPHLHFKVAHNSARLTTQMYFPGEPLNEQDMLIRAMGDRARRLIARAGASAEQGALGFDWEIVLPG